MGSRNIKNGDKFGRLTVIESYKKKGKSHKWMHLCECECGNEKIAYGSHLNRGATISCGCASTEMIKKIATKHGKHGTRTYQIWKGMRRRCNNKNDSAYPRYGAVGINVCAEWEDYNKFISEMGECPEGMSIDRIDGTKGYCRENCRWATDKQQARNQKARGNLPKGVKQIPSGKYVSTICENYNNHYLGSFESIDEAVEARIKAEEKYWGEER